MARKLQLNWPITLKGACHEPNGLGISLLQFVCDRVDPLCGSYLYQNCETPIGVLKP